LKWSVEGVLAAGAGYAVYLQRDQVGAAGTLFSHIRWSWLVAAMAFEAASMVVFARLQRWLLRSGGVNLCLRDMVEITLAGDSLSVTLPGGVAWGATFAYEQLRRRGADRTLAGWVILVAGALSSFALFLVFAAGTELAGPKGPVSSLRLPVLAVAAIPLVVAGLGVAAHRRPAVRRALRRQLARAGSHLPEGERAVPALEHLGRRLRTVQPSAGVWAVSLALAIANWLCDAATLFACIEALGFPVPWMGLLVAYSLAQISASLPITPGGIGVVEGSLTLALVAYGMGDNAAVASALLYRIVSFWALVPIGWSAWAYLELAQRRGRRPGRHHPWA
ncbi:MAG: lysylphosphatidylglycerol synthase transmembrane domain-containing protein, partial [Acidimicrobiales bacterium]